MRALWPLLAVAVASCVHVPVSTIPYNNATVPTVITIWYCANFKDLAFGPSEYRYDNTIVRFIPKDCQNVTA